MPTRTLTRQEKARSERQAHIRGLVCKVCGSSELVSRDTGLAFADGAVTVYFDCYGNPDHDTGASVQSEGRPPPPRPRPGETAPRA